MMKSKTVLVTSLAAAAFGLVSLIDTTGVLPFSSQFVSAQERVETRYLTAEEKAIDIKAEVVDDDHLVLKVTPKENFKGFLRGGETHLIPVVHNDDTGEVVWAYKGPEYGSIAKGKGFEDKWVVPRRRTKNGSEKIPDGRYYIRLGVPNAVSLKSSDLGNSNVFTIKNGKFVKAETSSTPKPDEKPKPTPTPTPTVQSGWVGSSYYQDGKKVTSKWIFDKKYNSFFYLDASGNYVQNAWVGNYYLKSGGYMAKSEWIFDKNYGAYYYLTSEGSYSYSTWVDSYYVKSNGKMATKEWIFDKNYDSYYYLTSEGSYARNAWAGSYYLKSDGKMAKGEWVYDNNYSSYYYLTSEGSYAHGTWVGDYYLKSNGKMAVNERTPDGYQVDESGKWISSQGTQTASRSLGISLYHVNDAMTYIDIALPSTPSSSYQVAYDFALVDANTSKVSTDDHFTATYSPSLRAFQTRHFFSATPDGSYRFVIKGKGQDGKVYDGQSVVFRVKNHRFVG